MKRIYCDNCGKELNMVIYCEEEVVLVEPWYKVVTTVASNPDNTANANNIKIGSFDMCSECMKGINKILPK